MKAYLALISAAALSLAACSQEPAQPAESNEPATEASAPAEATPASEAEPAAPAAAPTETASESAAAPAGDCATTVSAGDDMKFDATDININKSCKEFTITLKHTGKMPKTAMGHNIVVTQEADVDGVDKDGAAAGVDLDYVKPDDSRVIAHTKLIGGGEEDTITIDTSKFTAGNQYEFFCSFPGHIAMMRGKVNVN